MWSLMGLSVICSPLALLIGFVYPAYASYKSLELKDGAKTNEWLTYWVVFSLFTVFEGVADWLISWIPLYYPLKLAFIIWLQLPSTKGASKIYHAFIQPNLKRHEGRVDDALVQAQSFASQSVQDIRTRGVAAWGTDVIRRVQSRGGSGSMPGSSTGGDIAPDNSSHVA
jgi:hypothetical protein